jgi:histone acetyltransferase (RNA polymerase elongator complex component)
MDHSGNACSRRILPMKHFNIPIFIPHLGCPYECIYCNQKIIAAQHSIPSVGEVVQTIERYLLTIPPSGHIEVAFFGGSFTAVPRELQEAYLRTVGPFLQSGRVRSIRVSTRPDCIDEPALELLARYGVKCVELGVQSLIDKVLMASSRSYHPEDVFKSAALVKSCGLELGIQLMIGLPQDSREDDLETTRQVITLAPDSVRIYPTLAISGTTLADMWAQGQYVPLNLTEAVSICSDMFRLFQQAGIKVIRMGLHPGEELNKEGIIKAGPFHPSFGELVEQAVFKEQMQQALMKYNSTRKKVRSIRLYVHPQDISKAVGQKRSNILALCRHFDLVQVKTIATPDLARDSVGISQAGVSQPEVIVPRMEFLAGQFKELAHS